ncbi:hypothetical protein CGH72_08370 [Vibrio parahaemolyticus]|nr:hypothetical protein [Vibrio parahaemolyticus]TOK04714.1 hypothetical protein CGI25_22210 [Vibrio parahaemolyticus]TOM57121.1 hypothetical protein CGH75_14785 [Vibrio parahaemolyticus]TOM64809.1 hypothetical protein CGH73_20800 [Vibrio parahaemolyticus]TOM73534.1 hypothetical protein CGH72_08370 [Vibrio parahaemolyticus]TOO83645.1 hypothetical protein CGH29_19250 [Vibrio parahaemolyticus]
MTTAFKPNTTISALIAISTLETLRLLERAKAYESYITSQIQNRSSLYPDDLEFLRGFVA